MSETYEVVGKSLETNGIDLSHNGKLISPTGKAKNVSAGWRTVVGKAANYLKFYNTGDKVNVSFDDDGNVTFIQKAGSEEEIERATKEANKKFHIDEAPIVVEDVPNIPAKTGITDEMRERLDKKVLREQINSPQFKGMLFKETMETLRWMYNGSDEGKPTDEDFEVVFKRLLGLAVKGDNIIHSCVVR